MKLPCLIASYGGSGSTFLTQILKSVPNSPYFLEHTHAVPQNGLVGVPLYNRLTGHVEGPFSRHLELSLDAKIIIVYRDPAEAYLSRACYKHFLHIWSGTDRMEEVFGESETSDEIFSQRWQEYERAGQDIMGFASYISRWRNHAQTGRHDCLFVRYEDLDLNSKAIADFLDISEESLVGLNEFSRRARDIPEKLEKIFSGLREEMSTWPAVEHYEKRDVTSAPGSSPVSTGLGARRTTYTISGIEAGAGDAISRIGAIYNFANLFPNLDFLPPAYTNYHSPDLNFFDIFGIDKLRASDAHIKNADGVKILFSDFLHSSLLDSGFVESSEHFDIVADLYAQDWRLQHVRKYLEIPEKFLPQLSYIPSSNPFSSLPGRTRVVFHLRRHDIILSRLEDLMSWCPPHLFDGLHNRFLLTITTAVEKLHQLLPMGSEVEVIVSSDGIENVRQRFRGIPEASVRLDEIDAELIQEISSDKLSVTVVHRIIGTDALKTRQTLDAMHHADIVISASSSFPNLICNLGKTRLVNIVDGP